MHPLQDGIKSLSFEELEQRKSQIHKRMQMLRRSGNVNGQIWAQLDQLLDVILAEQQERFASMQDVKQTTSNVVINTDPLDIDAVPTGPVQKTPFRPVS